MFASMHTSFRWEMRMMTAAMVQLDVPAGVEVFEINGPFFFGMAHEFEEAS